MGEPKGTRLVFMGFSEAMIARTVLEELRAGIKNGDVRIEDWALLHKGPDGRVTIATDRSVDPGPVEGAIFGGAAGLALAIIGGLIGGVPVLGGALVGALVAGLMDGGLKDHEIKAIARLLAASGSGLMVAVPIAETGRFDAFVEDCVAFEAAISRRQVDIVPGRTFEQAMEEHLAAISAG